MTGEFPVPDGYRELDVAALPAVAALHGEVAARLGGGEAGWRVSEVSDGNMNAVFRIEGPSGSVIAKQAPPYIRVIGPDWPFPVSRIEYERRALIEHRRCAPETAPEVIASAPELGLIFIEDLSAHVILRHGLIAGNHYPRFAGQIGAHLAQTLFLTSTFALTTPEKNALAERFSGNGVLCQTTEDVIFTGPYWRAPLNKVTPGMEDMAAACRADAVMKLAAAEMKHAFRTRGEALIHGDLHTGSVMVTAKDSQVIDMEWAFIGPMGFDIGALIGNLLLAYFSQPGHATESDDRRELADWILGSVTDLWRVFEARFRALAADRPGDLIAPQVFDRAMTERLLDSRLAAIFTDALGFAGAKMTRRIIGISHVEDFEMIADVSARAACERRALTMARRLLLDRHAIVSVAEIAPRARAIAEGV